MDNWLANIVSDVDSLHVEIDNLNDLLVGVCFIRSIDRLVQVSSKWEFSTPSQETSREIVREGVEFYSYQLWVIIMLYTHI
jgi:hypothetical protein